MTHGQRRFIFVFALMFCSLGVGCSRPKYDPAALDGAVSNSALQGLAPIWSRQFDELLTDLQFSPDSAWVLASFVPHPEGGGKRRPLVRLLQAADGKVIWERETGVSVKGMALSNSQAVVVNFDDEVLRFTLTGQTLTSGKGHCRPIYLNLDTWFCLNDDAIKGGPAVLKMKGSILHPLEGDGDVLAYSVSPSQGHAVVASAGGRVQVLNGGSSKTHTFIIKGEALLAASSDQYWAVLSRVPSGLEVSHLEWNERSNPTVRSIAIRGAPRQMAWLGNELVVGEWRGASQWASFYRGNGARWVPGEERDLALRPDAWMPFEKGGDALAVMVTIETNQTRRSRIVGLGLGLRPLFMMDSKSGFGDLFQNFGLSPNGKILLTVADSGQIQAFVRE